MGPNPLRLFLSMMTPIYRQNMSKIGANQLGRFPLKCTCFCSEIADDDDENIEHEDDYLEKLKGKVWFNC